MPLLRLKQVHVCLSLTPLPPAHTQRGYDQADYKAGQRHRYFKVIILQPPRMSMDTHTNGSWILAIHWVLLWYWHQGTFCWGENKHGQCFPKGELSSSENPCEKLPADLTENFTGISCFFWPDLLRKLCTPNFWKSLHLESNTLLHRSSYNTYIP